MTAPTTGDLSDAQERMLESARSVNHAQNAPGHVPVPTFSRGADYSGWHRTADSLVRRGLLVSCSCYTKCLPGFEGAPQYWVLWQNLTEPQQRLLMGKPSRAKPSSSTIWNDDGSLTNVGAEVLWRAEHYYEAAEGTR